MWKFTNETDQTLVVNSLGFAVEPGGETPELDDDQAAGFLHQEEVWRAVGDDARAAQRDAIDKARAEQLLATVDEADLAPPPESANKAAWVDYAARLVQVAGADQDAVDAARKIANGMTKKQLIAELGNTEPGGAGDGEKNEEA